MIRIKRVIFLVLLATCATVAVADPATATCKTRNLGFGNRAAGWAHVPLSRLKHDTVYTLVQEDGHTVLRATADDSASLYVSRLKPPADLPASISWRWKTDALVKGADNRDKDREDAPLRVLVAFDGDVSSLPAAEQKRFRRAKRISGRSPPYALLMYIWSEQVPVDTVIPSAHTSQIKMLVAASGNAGLGRWHTLKRDLAADYRHAYGADPGRVTGVAVMTDTDNTNGKAVGEYADIRLSCAGN